MRTQQIVRTVVVGAMVSACVGAVSAQQIPPPLSGPAASGADYAHLSLVTPAPGGDSTLLYDLCNRRRGNMSFAWEDVGFGVDLANPLAGGVCATYQLTGQNYTRKPDTTLTFSNGPQHVPAYLPCVDKAPCDADIRSLAPTVIRREVAELTAVVTRRLAPELSRPTALGLPLHVIVRSASAATGGTVRVDWAGEGIKFLVCFPDGKIGIDELKRLVTTTTGGGFEFVTFPSMLTANLIVGGGPHSAALTISPGKSANAGTFTFGLSNKAPMPQTIILVVLDDQNRPVARLAPPLPPLPR